MLEPAGSRKRTGQNQFRRNRRFVATLHLGHGRRFAAAAEAALAVKPRWGSAYSHSVTRGGADLSFDATANGLAAAKVATYIVDALRFPPTLTHLRLGLHVRLYERVFQRFGRLQSVLRPAGGQSAPGFASNLLHPSRL